MTYEQLAGNRRELIELACELRLALERCVPYLREHIAMVSRERGLAFDCGNRSAYDIAEETLAKATKILPDALVKLR